MTKPNMHPMTENDDATYATQGTGRAFKMVRYALFLPLMWLRGIVVGLANAVGGMCFLGAVLGFIIVPDDNAFRTTALWSLMGASFCAFLLSWVYDGLLLWLSPEPIFLDGRVTH